MSPLQSRFSVLQDDWPSLLPRSTRGFLKRHPTLPWEWFRLQTFKNHVANSIRYDAPADPFESIEIRPREIEHLLSRTTSLNKTHVGGLSRVRAGEWDHAEHRRRVEQSRTIQSVIRVYQENIPWRETEYFDRVVQEYAGTEVYKQHGFDDLNEYVESILGRYDVLFENIKNNGYEPGHSGSRLRPEAAHPVRDRLEVLVTIGRGGDIYLWDGFHRFGIAHVLDLKIPVQVVCRHRQWQQLRDQVYHHGLSETGAKSVQDHPDLRDILD